MDYFCFCFYFQVGLVFAQPQIVDVSSNSTYSHHINYEDNFTNDANQRHRFGEFNWFYSGNNVRPTTAGRYGDGGGKGQEVKSSYLLDVTGWLLLEMKKNGTVFREEHVPFVF